MRLYRRADRDKDGELDAREFARTFDVADKELVIGRYE